MQLQTYPHYEIVIVNSSGNKVTNRQHPSVREYEVSPDDHPNLASLRNFGIETANGPWIMPIDDDDFQHAHRLMFQMAHRKEECCVLLSHQIRVDVQNAIICVHHDPVGIPGSIVFPKRNESGGFNLYDASHATPGEDKEFFERNFGDKRVVVRNEGDWNPGPLLMLCCHHGLNATSREDFMGIFADVQKYKGIRPEGVSNQMLDYIKQALRVYGLQLDEHQAEGPASGDT
jgi:glycosyltransferase involved in cell wall biosynthesis